MVAEQIRFRTEDDTTGKCFFGGILIDKEYVICGCCGEVYNFKDLKEFKRLSWVDISGEIKKE